MVYTSAATLSLSSEFVLLDASVSTFSTSSELMPLVVLLLCSSTPAFEIFFLGVLVLVLQFQPASTRVSPFRRFLSWMAVSAGPVALSEVATLPVQVPLL